MIDLHRFSDATKHAYDAAAYLSSTKAQEHVKSSLWCSKSMVSWFPIKTLKIPIIESALLLAHVSTVLGVLQVLQQKLYSGMIQKCFRQLNRLCK